MNNIFNKNVSENRYFHLESYFLKVITNINDIHLTVELMPIEIFIVMLELTKNHFNLVNHIDNCLKEYDSSWKRMFLPQNLQG